jgi:hypothetical protein
MLKKTQNAQIADFAHFSQKSGKANETNNLPCSESNFGRGQ